MDEMTEDSIRSWIRTCQQEIAERSQKLDRLESTMRKHLASGGDDRPGSGMTYLRETARTHRFYIRQYREDVAEMHRRLLARGLPLDVPE